MATTRHVVPCSQQVAFDILADPRSLGYLVAGARKIRRFEPRWPEPGSAAHYSAGIGPLVLRDRTTVVAVDPPHGLSLHAQVRPFGGFDIRFEFVPDGDRTEVTIVEEPSGGLVAAPVLRRAVELAIHLRNVELMRRLHGRAERRTAQRLGLERATAVG